MKWFAHDNDVHEMPLGQEIIARLGWAGYGRAHALLETLTKLVVNDGEGMFQLPLAKPTDLGFWSRKFQLSEQEVEETFDVFADARLIAPWRETQVIFAPLIGERLDEYTKRKNKRAKKLDDGDGPKGRKKAKTSAPEELPTGSGDSEPKTPLLPDSQSYQDRNRHGHSQSQSHIHSSRQYRDSVPIDAQGKAEEKTNPEPQRREKTGSKPSPSFSSHDMTMTKKETVGRFQGQYGEDVIRAVSDGEFNLAALKSYEYTGELADACREAIEEMQNQPFDGRTTCAKVMGRTMEILDDQSIKAPAGWLPILKALRADGGPARIKLYVSPPFGHIAAEDVLVDAASALHCYEEPLKPFNDLLVETAKYKGVPQSWDEAVPFLDCALDGDTPRDELGAMIAVRDKIQSRRGCPF